MDGLRLTKNVGGTAHNYIWQGDRLVSEHYNGIELEFFYDESGTPYAFDYNGAMYYYITNLQGDVIAIVNSSGGIVGTYKYDAWGAIVSAVNTNGSGVVNINPLRYRGYYYDSETGLYYLQSRYYDPEVCRFINADEYTSTGQDFLGYNMFAYCNNNPCNCADTRGNQAVKNTATMTSDSGYNGYARTYIELKKIEQISDSASLSELVSYIMNTDEDAVLNAEHIAFYKGAPVMLIDGTSSFSFGVIIMGRDGGERLLRHEYGHVRQLSERGVGNYLTTVVIPSVVCFQFANNDKMTWETYYSLPWEYQASSYGGADFAHKPWADSIMSIYSRIVG